MADAVQVMLISFQRLWAQLAGQTQHADLQKMKATAENGGISTSREEFGIFSVRRRGQQQKG